MVLLLKSSFADLSVSQQSSWDVVCELSKVMMFRCLKPGAPDCFTLLSFSFSPESSWIQTWETWIFLKVFGQNVSLSLSDMLKYQFFILHYSLVGFRLKNNSVRVQKRSCFSFKYLILSPQTRDVSLNISSGFMPADVEQHLDQWRQPSGVKPTPTWWKQTKSNMSLVCRNMESQLFTEATQFQFQYVAYVIFKSAPDCF